MSLVTQPPAKPAEPAAIATSAASAGRGPGQGLAAAAAPAVASVDGRVSRAQRLREERRAQVLRTARNLFSEHGYHKTSINDIIVAADIARGTFYLYFESKRAIFAELLDSYFATLVQAVKRIDVSPGAAAPLEQMLANVRRILEVVAAERAMARILLREAGGVDEEFDGRMAEFYGRVAQLIERGLELGMTMGLVRPCDARLVAWCVMGSVKEVVDRVVLTDRAPPDIEHVSRELVAFNLRGLFL